jgi:hypothetical protein
MPCGQEQITNRRPDERAARHQHLHRDKPADIVNHKQQDARAAGPADQAGRRTRRKSKNFAAQFSTEAAGSPKGEAAGSPKALIAPIAVQFLESIARSRSPRYDTPCTIKRCSSFSPSMYNFIRCLESCSRAPLVSERSASVPYKLSARSTGRMFNGSTHRNCGPQ